MMKNKWFESNLSNITRPVSMHSCVCACMHVRMYACMHAWLHLVCAQECRCIYISFASVWIHVPLQVCYLPVMYLCVVHFDTFCLLCPVSYLEHACCYFAFPCNRCNKENFELELLNLNLKSVYSTSIHPRIICYILLQMQIVAI